jgi:hypothetical protein
MKRMPVLLFAVAVVVAACTDPGNPPEAPVESPPAEAPAESPAGRCIKATSGNEFCDERAEGGADEATAYETAKQFCMTFTPREVAKEFGTASDPTSAAEGYAEIFRTGLEIAAFDGCLDGFKPGGASEAYG